MWVKEGKLKKLLMATVAVGMLAVSAPMAAHATHADYRGGCSFSTLNDTTPGGQLGGQNVWNGEVDLLAIATDSSANKVPTGASITGSCELKINGVSQGTVLGPTSGTGAVADAAQLQFTAAVTDIITLCDHITVDGESITRCDDATTTQIVPQPVIDALDGVLTTVVDALNTVIDLLNDTVFSQLDPTICSVLLAAAPTVNGLGHPELIHIDADGDLHVGAALYDLLFGDPTLDGVWDCPPYTTV